MTCRIVVPVNETEQSDHAVPIAVALARRMHLRVALVSAVEWPNLDHPGHAGYHESLMQPFPDVAADTIVVRSKVDTASAIRSVCVPGDILCIGAGHVSAIGEMLLSSVFFDLLRTFHGPVVAVGRGAVLPEGADRLLICVDGRARSEEGLALVATVGDPCGFQPFLVQTVDELHDAERLPMDTSESGYVRALAATVTSRYEVGWDVLHGDPSEAIASYANSPEVAMVGLATDALDALGRLISPSLANELRQTCPRPLLLMKPERAVIVEAHPIVPRADATPPTQGSTP